MCAEKWHVRNRNHRKALLHCQGCDLPRFFAPADSQGQSVVDQNRTSYDTQPLREKRYKSTGTAREITGMPIIGIVEKTTTGMEPCWLLLTSVFI